MARAARLQAEMAPVLIDLDAGAWVEVRTIKVAYNYGRYIHKANVVKAKDDHGKPTTIWTMNLLAGYGYIRRTSKAPDYQTYRITDKGSQRIQAFLARREKLLARKSKSGK